MPLGSAAGVLDSCHAAPGIGGASAAVVSRTTWRSSGGHTHADCQPAWLHHHVPQYKQLFCCSRCPASEEKSVFFAQMLVLTGQQPGSVGMVWELTGARCCQDCKSPLFTGIDLLL